MLNRLFWIELRFTPEEAANLRIKARLFFAEKRFQVVESSKETGRIIHELSEPMSEENKHLLDRQKIHGIVDWELRYKHMRHHTALHILSGVVFQKFGSKITGGQIYPERARLDFRLDDLSKERLQTILSEVNRIVDENREVKTFWLTTDEVYRSKNCTAFQRYFFRKAWKSCALSTLWVLMRSSTVALMLQEPRKWGELRFPKQRTREKTTSGLKLRWRTSLNRREQY